MLDPMNTQRDPMKVMLAARTALVLDQPFFGALALRLELQADPSCDTAWVDGRTIGFNPEFIAGLTQDECVAIVGHEVMHCAMGHPWRRSGRDNRQWNVACDYAINPVLKSSGFKLPERGLLDPQYEGKSSEWIYDRLPPGNDSPDKSGGEGEGEGEGEGGGQPQPDPLGEVRDAPDDGQEDGATEAEWQEAVQQAAQTAKKRGSLPSALDRFAKAAVQPRVDWRSALWRFVQERARADYSWTQPNRRYLPLGLYLPALQNQELGEIVWGFDTSGSVDDVLVAQFRSEIEAVAQDLQPTRVHVIYCDSRVQGVQTFERGDPIELRPRGGGGTRFEPVFEIIEELGIQPACVIYLTDMEGSFPDEEPDYPVLWATTSEAPAPFGEKVRCA
jgi:predicted metal-dependent peptidase